MSTQLSFRLPYRPTNSSTHRIPTASSPESIRLVNRVVKRPCRVGCPSTAWAPTASSTWSAASASSTRARPDTPARRIRHSAPTTIPPGRIAHWKRNTRRSPPSADITFPLTPDQQRIDLAGITLDILGPGGIAGPGYVAAYGAALGQGFNTGSLQTLGPGKGATTISGVPVPDGWLVLPHDGVGLSAAQVTQMVGQGILQATQTRAAIRLPLGSTTSMTFAVCDQTGEVLGLYRMPDSTVFSIGVAVAKARNVSYYNDATQLQPQDQLPGVPAGFAFTSRTFRYLTQPFYPEGVGPNPGIWSSLNDIAVNPTNGLNIGPALPASAYTSIEDFIAFNPQANFHDPNNVLNQNGVVLFPGSSGVYVTLNGLSYLVGGLGVSGDGVDQDDVVTSTSITGYAAPLGIQVGNIIFRGVRLPYQKFDRNPTGT
jgi:uncharacterized protein GlcG (DUF336 family)